MLLHLRWFPPRSTGGSTFRFAFFLFRDYSALLLLRFLLFLLFLLFLFPFLFNYVALTDHQLLRPLSSLFPFALAQSLLPLLLFLATLFYRTSQRHEIVVLRTANFTSWIHIQQLDRGIVHGAYNYDL